MSIAAYISWGYTYTPKMTLHNQFLVWYKFADKFKYKFIFVKILLIEFLKELKVLLYYKFVLFSLLNDR